MPTFLKEKGLNYSDVNLIAQPGVVKSRKEIPIEGWRIVVAGMTSITGRRFIKAVADLPENLRPTLHIVRDVFQEDNLRLCHSLGLTHIFVGVGLKTSNIENLAIELGYKNILLDVANGYLPQVKEKAKELRSRGFSVCTGSVHTEKGYLDLSSIGVDIVRSGIAPGSVCTTSDSTGFTRGTISEIAALYKAQQEDIFQSTILADGGIKSPSDCVKAFLAGADYVMAGKIFTEAFECRMHDGPEERVYNKMGDYFPESVYFGMASEFGKLAMGKTSEHIEGKFTKITPTRSLKDLLETTWAGIRSGVSYSGYSTLEKAIGNGVFEVKNS